MRKVEHSIRGSLKTYGRDTVCRAVFVSFEVPSWKSPWNAHLASQMTFTVTNGSISCTTTLFTPSTFSGKDRPGVLVPSSADGIVSRFPLRPAREVLRAIDCRRNGAKLALIAFSALRLLLSVVEGIFANPC
uniref:Uncharacterized protein n=1 Tax=Steinernema glaseri TaxID=37863 RepID=A0A1I7YP39_9BILA